MPFHGGDDADDEVVDVVCVACLLLGSHLASRERRRREKVCLYDVVVVDGVDVDHVVVVVDDVVLCCCFLFISIVCAAGIVGFVKKINSLPFKTTKVNFTTQCANSKTKCHLQD